MTKEERLKEIYRRWDPVFAQIRARIVGQFVSNDAIRAQEKLIEDLTARIVQAGEEALLDEFYDACIRWGFLVLEQEELKSMPRPIPQTANLFEQGEER